MCKNYLVVISRNLVISHSFEMTDSSKISYNLKIYLVMFILIKMDLDL